MMIVSDTSPLSNLAIVEQLPLLQQIYSNIIIPPAVYEELLQLERIRPVIKHLLRTGWLEMRLPTNRVLVETLQRELDEGEAEAIALAIALNADRLLIDERLGRRVATLYGLKITGLLGLLTAAKVDGHIDLVQPVLDQLIKQAGFRVSQELYRHTLQAVNESFD